MNQVPVEQRLRIVAALVEGQSIRSTARVTGVAKNTVTKLLTDLGRACAEYQNRALRRLPCKRIQVDEVPSLGDAKHRNIDPSKTGDDICNAVWTFTSLDADTRLAPCWMLGPRNLGTASDFFRDLASRLASGVQLTTDCGKPYLNSVEDAFRADLDHQELVKLYGAEAPRSKLGPGALDATQVFDSLAEPQNLRIGMSMRGLRGPTSSLAKRVQNLAAAVAVHFMIYNFGRVHQSVRVTPAMAAGISDHVWDIKAIVSLLDADRSVHRVASPS